MLTLVWRDRPRFVVDRIVDRLAVDAVVCERRPNSPVTLARETAVVLVPDDARRVVLGGDIGDDPACLPALDDQIAPVLPIPRPQVVERLEQARDPHRRRVLENGRVKDEKRND